MPNWPCPPAISRYTPRDVLACAVLTRDDPLAVWLTPSVEAEVGKSLPHQSSACNRPGAGLLVGGARTTCLDVGACSLPTASQPAHLGPPRFAPDDVGKWPRNSLRLSNQAAELTNDFCVRMPSITTALIGGGWEISTTLLARHWWLQLRQRSYLSCVASSC